MMSASTSPGKAQNVACPGRDRRPASTSRSRSSPTAGSSGSSDTSTSSSTPAQPASGKGETVKTATVSKLGRYLIDEDGKALYLFEKDTSPKSTCYGACAQEWPPVTTSGKPIAQAGATGAKLSTSTRTDGTAQVVYDGHPLYYFAADKRGTTKGQGLDEFGAEWYVLAPSGKKVENQASDKSSAAGGPSDYSAAGNGY